MARHLQREIEKLKKKILALGAIVEENLRQAFAAIESRDADAARQVILADAVIDENEVEVEEECLKILALYQPVAVDLRYIVAVIKINNDLERIGDLGANVAERAVQLSQTEPITVPAKLLAMFERVESMLERALDALVRSDPALSRSVLAADDEVDELYPQLIDELKAEIRAHLDQLDALVLLFAVARYLERLADHTTNIAEDVLYMTEGEIARHQMPAALPTVEADQLGGVTAPVARSGLRGDGDRQTGAEAGLELGRGRRVGAYLGNAGDGRPVDGEGALLVLRALGRVGPVVALLGLQPDLSAGAGRRHGTGEVDAAAGLHRLAGPVQLDRLLDADHGVWRLGVAVSEVVLRRGGRRDRHRVRRVVRFLAVAQRSAGAVGADAGGVPLGAALEVQGHLAALGGRRVDAPAQRHLRRR